jgi:hypothetical protein
LKNFPNCSNVKKIRGQEKFRLRVADGEYSLPKNSKFYISRRLKLEMKTPTNIQYIEQNGKPVFAVIPYMMNILNSYHQKMLHTS